MQLIASIKVKGPLLEGKAAGIIQDNLDKAITEAVMFMIPQIKAATPVGVNGDSGGLRGSELAEVTGKGTPLVKGIVATASPYGLAVEKGRRPGMKMPPAGTLLRWLEVKLGVDEKTAQRIEFVVRRKIAKQGFSRWPQGAQMFESTLDKYWPQVQGIFDRYGIRIAQELGQ
jgi:hypothetical protein